MASEFLRIRGARVHNLKNVDVEIPRNKLVVLTGLSGSGKSSLAFDTIYGSVTNKDLSDKLSSAYGISIDKRKIALAEPVKTFGTFSADAKLYTDVSAKIKFTVTSKK